MSQAIVPVVKLISKGFASKGAEAVGKGMKSLGDNSRDFLAASMAMEQVGKAFHVSGPAMGILSAQFKSQTMGARIELMQALLTLIQTEGMQSAISNFSDFMNLVFAVGGDVVDFITTMNETTVIKDLNRDIKAMFASMEELRIEIVDEWLPVLAKLFGLGPKTDDSKGEQWTLERANNNARELNVTLMQIVATIAGLLFPGMPNIFANYLGTLEGGL